MDIVAAGLLMLVLFALLGAGVWIGLALMGVAWIGMLALTTRLPGDSMAVTVWGTASSWTLTALPLFVWMGEILFRTRVSEDMFRGLAPWVEPLPGRLMHTNVVGCGGLCLISDFKGELAPGQAFHGHGTSSWDPAKKKYVGSWTDSMSNGIAMSEGTYDSAAKTMTGYMEGPDASGKMARMKSVVQYKDANSRVFTMYMPGPDGNEAPGMRITYTKRK